MAEQVTAKMEEPPASGPGAEVADPEGRGRHAAVVPGAAPAAIGPYLEFLGVGSFVLILVLFMLMGREDLSDRIVGLFGHRQVSLTTRTMEEIGQRISRYLATFALVNSGFGLVIGLGLWLIGVPYAVLWGCLAAMLRFIPYVGPAVAFVLPLVFSFAHFPGWAQPLEVVALFARGRDRAEQLPGAGHLRQDDGRLGPGPAGRRDVLDLALGDAGPAPLDPADGLPGGAGQVRAQPRLLRDAPGRGGRARAGRAVLPAARGAGPGRGRRGGRDGAEAAGRASRSSTRSWCRPCARAERDTARDELGEAEQTSSGGSSARSSMGWRGCRISAWRPRNLPRRRSRTQRQRCRPASSVPLVGLAVQDTSDALVLRMLGQLLAPSGCTLEIITDTESSLQVAERVAEHSPKLIVMSELPREGLSLGRYLLRQLRIRFADTPDRRGTLGPSG